jgi:hypothetical protein
MDDHQAPDREMIDLVVHKIFDYPAAAISIAS